MTGKKWFFVIFWIIGGLYVAAQAIYYFIGGESNGSSSLRNFLVIAQLFFGVAIAFYGWIRFRRLVLAKLKT